MTAPTPPPQPAAPRETANQSRDTAWAAKVTRLRVDPEKLGIRGINVDGRRLTGPVQGFGKMWQKTYDAILPPSVDPRAVITEWKAHFPEFWPRGNVFHGPLSGLSPGDVALLYRTMPGHVRLSTGVMVLYADDESFTLMTPQGHAFCGWITFSAERIPAATRVRVQVLMRAGDPLYEIGLILFAHRLENTIWQHTLRSVAERMGVPGVDVEVHATVVDRRRQWRRIGNTWHNAMIRSILHSIFAPLRRLAAAARRS